MKALKAPALREELIWHLKMLCDPVYQRRAWVLHEYKEENECHLLENTVLFLLDVLDLEEQDASARIGYYLYDEREAEGLKSVVSALVTAIGPDSLGKDAEKDMSSSDWLGVIETAKTAYELLTTNDARESVIEK